MKQWINKLLISLMSYQGEMVHNLLTKYPDDWKISEDLARSHIVFRDSNLGLKVGYSFSRFDISDQDSVKEFTFIDKLVLWPLAKEIRAREVYKYIQALQ